MGAFRKLPSIYVLNYFPFGFEGRIWDLIVSVPDHCLSFYWVGCAGTAEYYRASASCAVGQDGCRIDTWPRHTKDVIKMVPVATLLGAQHNKASTGFSSLTNHASLTSHN